MKPLDLTRFDLNLLVVLEALWAERHVGRAAQVPTLILKPEEDKLIGKEAAAILLKGIKGAQEVVMPRTGHMFRFSHPAAYSLEVRKFLQRVAL
ncbi:alpha/beta fold hydrolase [Pseudomonas sp. 13B_3.2_Bac1]|uniref:alpha/beta fold hydrolase n=1 Tax=Pseudomonas sp. 13B_3.2_Bac1 TaxID=2971623 RepID=UPI0039659854